MLPRNVTWSVALLFFIAPVLWGSDVSPATSSEPTPAAAHRKEDRLPRSFGRRVEKALDLAAERLAAEPQCRQLFSELGGDGRELLHRTVYRVATGREEAQLCARRIAAFTTIGGAETGLCRSFMRLSGNRAAVTLLHEALHFAGQAENPVPGAPTSAQINQTVGASCRLI